MMTIPVTTIPRVTNTMNTQIEHNPILIAQELKVATGKNWQEWVSIITEWDEPNKSFRAIYYFVQAKYWLNDFWARVIAYYYVWEYAQKE
jgi:hypothetical protein